MFALIIFDSGWLSLEIAAVGDVEYHPDRTVTVHSIEAQVRFNLDKIKALVLLDSADKVRGWTAIL